MLITFRSSTLIKEIRKNRCLWDSKFKDPSDKELRGQKWFDVGANLFPNWMELNEKERSDRIRAIKQKWKHIRDYYKKGRTNWTGKSYVYSHLLGFLDSEALPKIKPVRIIEEGPYCVFCVNSKRSHTPLKAFTEQTLQRCSEILEIRQEHNLGQRDVILPEQHSDRQKYHASCYKRFTGLPPKQRICLRMQKATVSGFHPDPDTSLIHSEDNINLYPSLKLQSEILDDNTAEDFSIIVCESEIESCNTLPIEEHYEEFTVNENTEMLPTSSSIRSTNSNKGAYLPNDLEHDDELHTWPMKKELQDVSGDGECTDSDKCFLLSLLPEIKIMNNLEKISFKIQVLNELQSIIKRRNQVLTVKEEPRS